MTMQQPTMRDDRDEYDGRETAQLAVIDPEQETAPQPSSPPPSGGGKGHGKDPCVQIEIPLTPGQHKNVEAGCT